MEYSKPEQKLLAFVDLATPEVLRKKAWACLGCGLFLAGMMMVDAIATYEGIEMMKHIGYIIAFGGLYGMIFGHMRYQANVASVIRKIRGGVQATSNEPKADKRS